METHHLNDLLKKYRENCCTPDEMAELTDWYDRFEGEAEKIAPVPEEKLEMLYRQIVQNIVRIDNRHSIYFRARKLFAVAAILSILLGTGLYFAFHFSIPSNEEMIAPGRYQAELILSDGSSLALDSTTTVTETNGALIKEHTQATLDYSRLTTQKPGTMNTIKIPLGGEYSVILSDGSQVWLNSGSSLTYPVVFDENNREVFLTGEGFFKVTPSAVPFGVKTTRLDVKVLGTSFNVSAYEEDGKISTALVTGCIEVSGERIPQAYRITPGHILTYSKKSGEVSVAECDTEIYTSWLLGEFKFRDMRLGDIMKKLNRWYNCTIIYDDPALQELRFSGAAEKDRPVNYLLDMIETITDVRFEISGGQIFVKHK